MHSGSFLCKNQNSDDDLHSQDQGHTHDELDMLGLVAEGVHAQNAAYAAADGSHQKQSRFRNSPKIFLGLDFIHKHKNEAYGIDYKKIDQ